jgi:hypothetical protein
MSRFAKFLEKRFKTKEDSMGIPSIIIVEGAEQNLVQSIDRNKMKNSMMNFLMKKVALSSENAKNESESYIETKYKEYMEFVMKL